MTTFQPARFLGNRHLQTVWGYYTRPPQAIAYERETLTTIDGDELIVDHLRGRPTAPRLLLLHGLEGSSHAPPIMGMAARAHALGWWVSALNFRSCARHATDPRRYLINRRPRLYHSGETSDFDYLVRRLIDSEPDRPLLVLGISLGGNVLLKWLGEGPIPPQVQAAAALAVPFDLAACADYLDNFVGRIYAGHFLRTLKRKVAYLLRRFPELPLEVDLRKVLRAKNFREFDGAATAPLHGFFNADDYYRRCSTIDFIHRIEIPTLCLNAIDDPFVPPATLARVQRRMRAMATALELRITRHGGHAGFVAGTPLKPLYWAESFAIEWLASQLSDEPTIVSSSAPSPSVGL